MNHHTPFDPTPLPDATPPDDEKPGSPSRRMQGCCYDCGRRYGDEYGFPDLDIPNDAWLAISPTGTEGGLLCPSCICRRLHLAGIQTTGAFASGPLCVGSKPVEQPEPDCEALRKTKEALDQYRNTSLLIWTDKARDTLVTLLQTTPALIELAERCQAGEQRIEELQQPMPQLGDEKCSRCGKSLIFSARAIGDGLCHACGHKLAKELTAQPRGLSDEDSTVVDRCRSLLASYGCASDSMRLRRIIDRLAARKPTLPWRKGGESHFTDGIVLYVDVHGTLVMRTAGNWKWARTTRWCYGSDLLATLPQK